MKKPTFGSPWTSDTEVKYGDVVRFEFSGTTCTAMVIATSVHGFVATDEGTSFVPGMKNRTIVFGLTNEDEARTGRYHRVSQTAVIIGSDYKVFRR